MSDTNRDATREYLSDMHRREEIRLDEIEALKRANVATWDELVEERNIIRRRVIRGIRGARVAE